jgi:amino acid transporter
VGGIIAFFPPKYSWGFVFWSGVITLVALVIFFVALAFITIPTFKSAYDTLATSQNFTTYSGVISKGALSSPGPITATFIALPFVWFAYVLYNTSSAWAGEMKSVRRSSWIAIVGSVSLAAIYYILFTILAFRAFGQNFLEAWSNLTAQGSSPIPSIGTYVPFFAFVAYPSTILFFIIFLSQWLPFIYQVPVFIISQTRYIFSWAWDRVLPERLATVSERFHTPVLANLVITAGAVTVAFLATFVPQSSVVLSSIPLFTLVFIIPCLAAVLFPYVRRDLYETSVIVKRKLAGIPVLVWLGVATLGYLFSSVYLAVIAGSMVLNAKTAATYLGIYGLGAVVFLVGYYRAKRRGIPIELAFKQIPPE